MPATVRRARLSHLLLPATVAATLALSGCSGGNSGGSSAAASAVSSAKAPAASAGSIAEGKAATSAPKTGSRSAAGGVVGRKLSKQASLRVQVANLNQSAASVRSITVSLRGIVLTEQIGDGSSPPVPVETNGGGSGAEVPSPDTSGIGGAYAALTVSVPSNRLDHAIAQLGRLGKVVSQSSSTQDVTATFIDTQSRLATMRASVDRVRLLMQRAKDIGQVVTLETQLSKRQADLESLQAQLADVQDSVAQSIVSLTLTTAAARHTEPVAATGFGSGLSAGWHAFSTSVTAVLTAIGAVLPFAVVLGLLAGPALWWRRQRSARGQSQPVT